MEKKSIKEIVSTVLKVLTLAMGGSVVVLSCMGKRILFPPYDEIEVTGKYEIDCEDYWVTEDKEDSFFKDGSLRFLKSENENYEDIYYEGTSHMGLCDLSLASPILSGMVDQVKSEIEQRKQLKRLNADCLDFLQRL